VVGQDDRANRGYLVLGALQGRRVRHRACARLGGLYEMERVAQTARRRQTEMSPSLAKTLKWCSSSVDASCVQLANFVTLRLRIH